eukprot:3152768-Rhodomonas_salina.1
MRSAMLPGTTRSPNRLPGRLRQVKPALCPRDCGVRSSMLRARNPLSGSASVGWSVKCSVWLRE